MANNPKFSTEVVNAHADAVTALADNGYLRIYDGAQPATANTAVSTQNLLAELRLGATAFGDAVEGICTANAITADSSANASGQAGWFRVLKSDGSSPLWDGTVGTAGCDLNLNSVTIGAGAQVSVTSMTYTASKG